ncbi:MAG: pilus assembly protein TadB, partial [Nitrospirota bacterium]|nr:pilus assembly protein TadB [Nitrospirota bacterium]
MGILIGIGIFVSIVLLIEGAFFGYRKYRDSESTRIKRRLRTLSAGGSDFGDIDILRKRVLSEVPWLNRFLLGITRIHHLDRLLEQANTRMPLGLFLSLSVLSAALGFLIGILLKMEHVVSFILGLFLGSLPFIYLLSLKQKRMSKFQEQLPDAMDLIARALKAGHAFSGGLKMVADEFSDPIGTE